MEHHHQREFLAQDSHRHQEVRSMEGDATGDGQTGSRGGDSRRPSQPRSPSLHPLSRIAEGARDAAAAGAGIADSGGVGVGSGHKVVGASGVGGVGLGGEGGGWPRLVVSVLSKRGGGEAKGNRRRTPPPGLSSPDGTDGAGGQGRGGGSSVGGSPSARSPRSPSLRSPSVRSPSGRSPSTSDGSPRQPHGVAGEGCSLSLPAGGAPSHQHQQRQVDVHAFAPERGRAAYRDGGGGGDFEPRTTARGAESGDSYGFQRDADGTAGGGRSSAGTGSRGSVVARSPAYRSADHDRNEAVDDKRGGLDVLSSLRSEPPADPLTMRERAADSSRDRDVSDDRVTKVPSGGRVDDHESGNDHHDDSKDARAPSSPSPHQSLPNERATTSQPPLGRNERGTPGRDNSQDDGASPEGNRRGAKRPRVWPDPVSAATGTPSTTHNDSSATEDVGRQGDAMADAGDSRHGRSEPR